MGLDPLSERRSLKDNPLPEEDDINDSLLPSHIAIIEQDIVDIEKQILALNEKLSNLNDDKSRLIDRAVKTGHVEDMRYRIEKRILKGNRIADPKKLKPLPMWPVYEKAWLQKIERDAEILVTKGKDKLEKEINLGIADKIFGKETVDSCSTRPETIQYEVERKKQ